MSVMSEESRNAEVRLSADVDPYVESVQKAGEETNKFSTTVDKLTTKVEKLYKEAGKKLVLFGGATGVGIAGVTKQAADLEKRMSTLQATAAVTTKNLTGFEKEINKLGKNLPITNKAAVELVTTLDKMGVQSTRKIGEIADSMVKLQAATGESLGGLTTGMVDLGRKMGTLAAGDMSTFANSLLTVSKNAGVSAENVLGFANAIAGTARAAGMTEQQVLGISAAFSKAGADGYAAATTFTQILTDIQRQIATGSPDLAKYANLIGVTSEQLATMDKGEALVQIFEAINAQGEDAVKTLDRLGFDGVRAFRELQKVTQAGGIRQAMGLATSTTDNLTPASEAAMDGLADNLTKTGNALERLAQIAGGPFLEVATRVSGWFNGMLGLVTPLAEAFSGLASRLTSVAGIGAGLLGTSILMSRVRTAVTAGGFVARSQPVRSALGGFRVGRGIAENQVVTNDATRALMLRQQYDQQMASWRAGGGVGPRPERIDGMMRGWARPFFTMSQGIGRAMGPGGGPSIWGPIVSSPLRLGTYLTQAQTEYIQQARTGGFQRSAPFMNQLSDARMGMAGALRNPMAFLRGFNAADFRLPSSQLDDRTRRLQEYAERRVSRGQAVPDAVARRLSTDLAAAGAAARKNAADTAAEAQAKRQNTNATRTLSAASGGLAKAWLAMQAQSMITTGANVARGVGWGAKQLGTGMLGLVGGPWGAALTGGIIAGGAIAKRVQSSDDFDRDRAASIDAYRVALGYATEELGGFTSALKNATNALPKPAGFGSTETISPEVVALARTAGRKLTNPEISNFAESPEAAAAWMSNLGITDPREMQQVQADLVQAMGSVGRAQQAVDLFFQSGGPQSQVNFSGLLGQVQNKQAANTGGFWGWTNPFLTNVGIGGSGQSRDMISDLYEDIESRSAKNATKYNAEYANRQQWNEIGSLVAAGITEETKSNITGKAEQQTLYQLVNYLEKQSGLLPKGTDLGFYAPSFAKDAEAAGVDLKNEEAKAQYFIDWLQKKLPDLDIPDYAGVSELAKLQAGPESPVNQRIRGAGRVGAALLDDPTIGEAIAKPDDINAQYKATQRLIEEAWASAGMAAEGLEFTGNTSTIAGQQVGEMGTKAAQAASSFAAADAELQRAKAAIGDTTDPRYQQLQAAQQMLEVRRQAEMPYMSREQRLGQSVDRYRSVMDGDRNAPDFEQRRQAAEGELIAAKQQQYDYMKSLVQAHKDFAIQRGRVEEDRQRSLAQGEEDFQRQMMYSEKDYLKQRNRAQDDFTRQMERHGKDQAKAIYDPMQRMWAQYTTDAGTLLQNLEDQNRRIMEQTANLSKASSLGLSKESIETLNLADASQAENLARIVGDLAADPMLATAINEQVSTRIRETTKLTESQYNETFQRQQEDWNRERERQESDYQEMISRTNEAHAIALDREAETWAIQTQRSLEDLARLGEEIFGSFEEVMAQAVDLITKNLGSLGDSTIGELNRVAENFPEFLLTSNELGAQGNAGYIDPEIAHLVGAGGRGGMANTGGGQKMAGRGPNMYMAEGGIATRTIDARIGEAGPEGIIPLNHRGVGFLAGLYQEISKQLVRDLNTIGTPTSAYYGGGGGGGSIDASTNFTGPVTVQAQDPDAMGRALKEKARVKKLTRPTLSPQ